MGFINQRSHLWGAPSCNWQFQNNIQVANVGIGMPREEQELAGSYMERDNVWFSELSVELPGNSWGISWMMYFWGASAAPHKGRGSFLLVEFDDGQFDKLVDSMMVTFICFTARLALMCKVFQAWNVWYERYSYRFIRKKTPSHFWR